MSASDRSVVALNPLLEKCCQPYMKLNPWISEEIYDPSLYVYGMESTHIFHQAAISPLTNVSLKSRIPLSTNMHHSSHCIDDLLMRCIDERTIGKF